MNTAQQQAKMLNQNPPSRNHALTMGQIQAMLDQQSKEEQFQEAKDQDAIDQAAMINSSAQQLKVKLQFEKDEAKRKKEEAKLRKAEEKEGLSLKQRADRLAAQQKKQAAATFALVHDQFMNTTDKVTDAVKDGWSWLGSIPTPGSIFFPVSVLFLFFFLVFPVNGHTRAEWFFMACFDQAVIEGVT